MRYRPQVLGRLFISLCLLVPTIACGQRSGVADGVSDPISWADPGVIASPDGTLSPLEGGSAEVAAAQVAAGGTVEQAGGETVPAEPRGFGVAEDQPTESDDVEKTINAPRPPSGGNRTGVSDSMIKIGMHVPFTRGPPQAAASANIYWKTGRQTVLGRSVEMIVVDDEYEPAKAHGKCRDLIEKEEVFALIGVAGAFQMQACARLAAKAGVPYLALGSSEALFQNNPVQFAISMPYTRQVTMIADVLEAELDAHDHKNGFLRVAGGVRAESQMMIDELNRRGISLDAEMRLAPLATYQEWEQAAIHFKQEGVRNIIFGADPYAFMQFLSAAARQNYYPRLTGGGLTVTFDEFVPIPCRTGRAGHGALFFSPFPAYEDNARFDPAFSTSGGTNDADWMFWALSKTIDKILELPGKNLTRERLLWYVSRIRKLDPGIMPPVSFAPGDHFSNHSMHLLRANCDKGLWENYRTYVRP